MLCLLVLNLIFFLQWLPVQSWKEVKWGYLLLFFDEFPGRVILKCKMLLLIFFFFNQKYSACEDFLEIRKKPKPTLMELRFHTTLLVA